MVSLYVHEFSTLTKFVVYQSSTNSSSVKDKLLKNSEPFFFFFFDKCLKCQRKIRANQKRKKKKTEQQNKILHTPQAIFKCTKKQQIHPKVVPNQN